MTEKFNFQEYSKKYSKQNFEQINFVVHKGCKNKLKEIAKKENKTVSELIKDILQEKYNIEL